MLPVVRVLAKSFEGMAVLSLPDSLSFKNKILATQRVVCFLLLFHLFLLLICSVNLVILALSSFFLLPIDG